MRHFLQIFSLQLKSGPDPSFCHEDHSRSTKELDDAVVGTYARKNGIPEIKKICITLSSRRTKRCQVLLFFMRHYSAKSVHAWEVLEYWIVSNMRTADIFFFDL